MSDLSTVATVYGLQKDHAQRGGQVYFPFFYRLSTKQWDISTLHGREHFYLALTSFLLGLLRKAK